MDDDTVPTRAELVRFYLDTLAARMEPEEFRLLGRLVGRAVVSLADPGEEHLIEVPAEDAARLTPEVRNELLTVLSIVATGTMEHQLVDLGDGATTVLDTAAANDPEMVGRMREWTARRRAGRTRAEGAAQRGE